MLNYQRVTQPLDCAMFFQVTRDSKWTWPVDVERIELIGEISWHVCFFLGDVFWKLILSTSRLFRVFRTVARHLLYIITKNPRGAIRMCIGFCDISWCSISSAQKPKNSCPTVLWCVCTQMVQPVPQSCVDVAVGACATQHQHQH